MINRLARLAPIFALSLGLAHAALAESPCQPDGVKTVPIFEPLEAAFMKMDMGRLLDVAATKFHIARPNGSTIAAFKAALHAHVPRGFANCQVILQREDSGGMIQRITVYYALGEDYNVYLYQRVIPKGDGQELENYALKVSLNDVRALLM